MTYHQDSSRSWHGERVTSDTGRPYHYGAHPSQWHRNTNEGYYLVAERDEYDDMSFERSRHHIRNTEQHRLISNPITVVEQRLCRGRCLLLLYTCCSLLLCVYVCVGIVVVHIGYIDVSQSVRLSLASATHTPSTLHDKEKRKPTRKHNTTRSGRGTAVTSSFHTHRFRNPLGK